MLGAVCPLTQAFITEDDKEELLKAHNFYRGKVSPIATNMAKLVGLSTAAAAAISLLYSIIQSFSYNCCIRQFCDLILHFQTWDDELALLAHFWSANCELMPNENRHDQSTVFDYVGQISAASANYTINLTSMVFQWYYEGLSFDYSQAACVDEDGEAQDEAEGCERYIQVSLSLSLSLPPLPLSLTVTLSLSLSLSFCLSLSLSLSPCSWCGLARPMWDVEVGSVRRSEDGTMRMRTKTRTNWPCS